MEYHLSAAMRGWGGKYERLSSRDTRKAIRERQLWVRKVAPLHGGRANKGIKLALRAKKLNWKPFTVVFLLSRRVVKAYGALLKSMKMDEACPAIVFSCQWGLPVLSHSSVRTRMIKPACQSLTWFN